MHVSSEMCSNLHLDAVVRSLIQIPQLTPATGRVHLPYGALHQAVLPLEIQENKYEKNQLIQIKPKRNFHTPTEQDHDL